MIEVYGDLWSYPADARVITTNGSVKKGGSAVMGRGCALEAKELFPSIDTWLGSLLLKRGSHVFANQVAVTNGRGGLNIPLSYLFTFPVKHRWDDREGNWRLIVQSANELVAVVTALDIGKVVMPRPGCGNGRLPWEDRREGNGLVLAGVKTLLSPILDDRFCVITHAAMASP